MEKPCIVYIHGASSTSTSFNFISRMLPNHTRLFLEYDSGTPIKTIVNNLYTLLPRTVPLFLIGHSLGGVIATLLSYAEKYDANVLQPVQIQKIVAISSPFGGSRAANYLRWMYPAYGLFDNVATNTVAMSAIKKFGAIFPTLSIVSTGGNTPLIRGSNDGVLSVDSQSALANCVIKEFKLNHFEVLLSDKVVSEINGFLQLSPDVEETNPE